MLDVLSAAVPCIGRLLRAVVRRENNDRDRVLAVRQHRGAGHGVQRLAGCGRRCAEDLRAVSVGQAVDRR